MPWLELPHSHGCLVCGRDNSLGLKLTLRVDPDTGIVRIDYIPRPEHIGFVEIVHGGVLATVIDEAMVWAATWERRRFCVCGEMAVRFRRSARVGRPLLIEAKVQFSRTRLTRTTATVHDGQGNLLVEASGSYVPVPPEEHARVLTTLVEEESTREALALLRQGERPA